MNRLKGFCLAAVPFFVLAGSAQAGFITVYGWATTENLINFPSTPYIPNPTVPPFGASMNALNDSSPGFYCNSVTSSACTTGNAGVTFTTDGVNLGTAGNTFAAWLASSAFAATGVTYGNGVTAGTALDPSIWEFTGIARWTTGQTLTYRHDDGLSLLVNGAPVITEPGIATAQIETATYLGPTGDFSFLMVYDECCQAPGTLTINIAAPMPEPGSWFLVGTALLAVIGRSARRKLASR
jgi:hypothetical protein